MARWSNRVGRASSLQTASLRVFEVGSAEGQVALEGARVPEVRALLAPRELGRGPVKGGLCLKDARSPTEVRSECLGRIGLAFLGEVADGRTRGGERHAAGVRLFEPGEDAQERGLADAIRPEDTQPCLATDGEAHVLEDGLRASVLGEVSRDERRRSGEHRARAETCGSLRVTGVRHVDPQGESDSGWTD